MTLCASLDTSDLAMTIGKLPNSFWCTKSDEGVIVGNGTPGSCNNCFGGSKALTCLPTVIVDGRRRTFRSGECSWCAVRSDEMVACSYAGSRLHLYQHPGNYRYHAFRADKPSGYFAPANAFRVRPRSSSWSRHGSTSNSPASSESTSPTSPTSTRSVWSQGDQPLSPTPDRSAVSPSFAIPTIQISRPESPVTPPPQREFSLPLDSPLQSPTEEYDEAMVKTYTEEVASDAGSEAPSASPSREPSPAPRGTIQMDGSRPAFARPDSVRPPSAQSRTSSPSAASKSSASTGSTPPPIPLAIDPSVAPAGDASPSTPNGLPFLGTTPPGSPAKDTVLQHLHHVYERALQLHAENVELQLELVTTQSLNMTLQRELMSERTRVLNLKDDNGRLETKLVALNALQKEMADEVKKIFEWT